MMSDTDAINALIKLLESTVALVQQYDPLFSDMPGVSDLVKQVNQLKIQRGL